MFGWDLLQVPPCKRPAPRKSLLGFLLLLLLACLAYSPLLFPCRRLPWLAYHRIISSPPFFIRAKIVRAPNVRCYVSSHSPGVKRPVPLSSCTCLLVSFAPSSGMADHFAFMTGRMITEATLQSAICDVPSVKAAYDPSAFEDGRTKSGVVVECRICQEEGDEAYMETPCSCKGSLKYAHHICIQRWCNEKGDTKCEICLQQFTPNYSAPLKLFRIGRNQIIFRRAGETPENLNTEENVSQTADHAVGTSGFESQGSNPKCATYCRFIAIALMSLLILRDAISLALGGPEVCSMALITLLMFRTAGVVIPIYIILISVATLIHRYNQHQGVHDVTPVTEPVGAEGSQSLQPMPPQQHVISIQ